MARHISLYCPSHVWGSLGWMDKDYWALKRPFDKQTLISSSRAIIHAPKITGVPRALVMLWRCEIEGNKAVWGISRSDSQQGGGFGLCTDRILCSFRGLCRLCSLSNWVNVRAARPGFQIGFNGAEGTF